MEIPRFKERIDNMLFRATFSERITQLGKVNRLKGEMDQIRGLIALYRIWPMSWTHRPHSKTRVLLKTF